MFDYFNDGGSISRVARFDLLRICSLVAFLAKVMLCYLHQPTSYYVPEWGSFRMFSISLSPAIRRVVSPVAQYPHPDR